MANKKNQVKLFGKAYTHPWTDEDLYKYFNLSDDEIKIIESEIK